MTPDEIALDVVRQLRWDNDTRWRDIIAAAIAAERERAEKAEAERSALWDALIPPHPRCRDCADHNGRCQDTGHPCDPQAWALEIIAGLKKAEAERDAMSAVMGQIFGARFLDPPDGGDVPLPEQVRRLCEALQQAEAERDEARAVLRHILKWLDRRDWGTWPYHEGTEIHKDRRVASEKCRAVLALIDKKDDTNG